MLSMNGWTERAVVPSKPSWLAPRSCWTLMSMCTSAKSRSPMVARCAPLLGNASVGSHLVVPRLNCDDGSCGPTSVVQRLDLGTRCPPASCQSDGSTSPLFHHRHL